ncbi:MAG: cysteine hydrolase [Chloroflexi bacterium]|nr:cysteine hydrolase [Chloroflexota bacterium]
MIEVDGKLVYETLAEIVQPEHTAVVVVDMQNDYCAPGGETTRAGRDISHVRATIEPQARLIKKAAEVGAMVVFIKNTTEPGCLSDSPAWLYFKTRVRKGPPGVARPQMSPEVTIDGTWGHEIVDELKGLVERPVVVKKYRSSAFVNTNLYLILRSNGIESVVITGCVTQSCVDSTARDASFHDYYVVLARDCVGSPQVELHEAALKVLAARYDVVDSSEIIAAWSKVRQPV